MTPGVQAYRRRAAATERMVDAAVAAVKAERRAAWDAQKRAAAEREAARRRFTRDEIVGAGFVHDGHSWRKVVRVNAKTVSVESGYSWVDKIAFDKVHGVQMPLDEPSEDEIAEWLAWHEGGRDEALMYLEGGICKCCGVSYREGVDDE